METTLPRNLETLVEDLKPRNFSKKGRIWIAVLVLICLNGLISYYFQLRDGLGVTGMTDYVSWGIYISNFVFFVAVSLVGSLISAILRLSRASWSIPIARVSEIIAVASITFAGIIIVVDMGRPERLWTLLVYGRIQSPIIWDVIVVTTYLVMSILLLYLPLIPDYALLRDRATSERDRKVYSFFSLNFKDTPEQRNLIDRSVFALSILVIPVALGIHTVTSWLFATTLRAGWNSTNMGPYFVAGAFMVGAAAVIIIMYVLRQTYTSGENKRMEKYYSDKLFDNMGKLLVLLSLIYLYFNINEYLTPAFKMMEGERHVLEDLFAGEFAGMFWGTQIVGMVIPIIILLFPKGRKPLSLFIVSIIVVVGAWFKRYLIVIPTLFHPYLPIEMNELPQTVRYIPTYHEWSITLASLAGAMLLATILIRFIPPVGIDEMAEVAEKEEEKRKFYEQTKFASK
jgi:molybdopterin-containing oxidoreductase family membrane subunit